MARQCALYAPIVGPSFEKAITQVFSAINHGCGIELRLDLLTALTSEELFYLLAQPSLTPIIAVRSERQGGLFKADAVALLALLKPFLNRRELICDIEWEIYRDLLPALKAEFPKVKWLLSHHQFGSFPANLKALFKQMQKTEAHYYKLALETRLSTEALELLLLQKENPDQLIAIPMGERGSFARILTPIFSNLLTICSLDEFSKTAKGQLTISELIEVYRTRKMDKQTKIYCLIGNPTHLSRSHKTHNALFERFGLNAIYIKIDIEPAELDAFLFLAKQLPIEGMSVTMPLKELLVTKVNELDVKAKEIGAINTLVKTSKGYCGYNTDAIGARRALEEELGDLSHKRVILIGTGGAARAIAFELHAAGCLLTIFSRDCARAEKLAQEVGCDKNSIEAYDLVIHASNYGPDEPLTLLLDKLCSNGCLMECISVPTETHFTQEAKKRGMQIVYGKEMFIEQAVEQFYLWLQIKRADSLSALSDAFKQAF